MQVYILGDTPQVRGLQLETLTKSILKDRGYSKLIDRQISSGGHEIDVVGEIELPMMNDTRTIKVVCECKAHAKPIGTTDWLKFLGKVYVEEVNTGNTVNGCFISLSGVNGNVSGSFENLKQKKKSNVELISGDDLYSLLIKCFPAINREQAINIINNQSDKRIINVSLAYYDSQIFWVISLESDRFTVLNSNGDILNSENTTVCLLNTNMAGTYLDLEEEKKKIEHQKLIESVIFTVLAKHNGKLENSQCFSDTEEKLNASKVELTKSCYDQAIKSICDQEFSTLENNTVQLKLFDANATVMFLRYVFPLGINIDLLTSEYFENLLDSSLLNEIQEIQCGLIISEEDKDLCLKVLRSSPSALWLAINEIGMITHHRKTQPESTEQLDKHDNQLFIRYICEKLQADYDNPNLKQFYFEKAEIVELDFQFSLKAKSKKEICFEHSNRVRNVIAQACDSIGGGLIRVLALNDSPEPWENYSNKDC